jgi:enamine deaminase RidA (YjgF/YER057c/UK114 family)
MKPSAWNVSIFVLLVGAGLVFAAQEKKPARKQPPAVRYLNPEGLSTPRGYSHTVEVNSGRTVFIAGQVSLDAKGNVVGINDFRAQATQVFENLRLALNGAGADFSNLVKLNIYVLDTTHLPALREVRDKHFGSFEHRPASTLVQVVKLARNEFLIEIEAVAVVPAK